MTQKVQSTSTSRNLHAGAINSWSPTPFGLEGTTENGVFNLSVYGPKTVRVQVSRSDEFNPNPYSVVKAPVSEGFEVSDGGSFLLLQTDYINVEINKTPFAITFKDQKGNIINQDDQAFSVSWLGTEVTNYKKLQENERFIGLGEKTGNLDRSGNAYTNWNTDYFAYGTDDDPLYMSIPFYVGIHDKGSYGIFFDNSHKTVFNFGASNNRFAYYSAEDGEMDYYFFHDAEVKGIISAYSDLTGRMQLPPKWALGYQQCRYSYYPDSEVLTLSQTFRDKKVPADVIYLDIHHMEKYKVFTFDGEKFPDPKAMIQTLKDRGFKVVVIMDPGIRTEEDYEPYVDGKEKDLFLKYPDDSIYEGQVWPGWCAFPDYTNPETRDWWAEKMKFYTEAGVDGFWTDMNEPATWGQCTPNLIDFDFEGQKVSHRKARNIYGMQMARSVKEGAEKISPDARPFVLTRAGFSGIQRYAAAWTGDNVASEDHMLAGVRLLNSMGISGIPFSGYDIGGFAGDAAPSLYARWMSIATFAPLFRAHSMINSNDAEPWAFGEEVEEISRNYIKLRYKLLPTIYSAFYRSTLTGLPLTESLAIQYSQDPNVFDSKFQDQYIFCDAFLVAPVKSTRDIAKVYLPKGDWYYFFNDQHHKGGNPVFVESPLNYLPVFVKGGSIIALQSETYHTGEKHDGILNLHFYKGKGETRYVHYEDDGISNGHKDGDFCKRIITLDSDSGSVTISSQEGAHESTYKTYKLHFHGFSTKSIQIGESESNLKKENLAFLEKLTEFDPLPEHLHPFHEVKNVFTFEIENTTDAVEIELH
ncbi:glycoside hydrolase family 31 protein [Litoribacter ruber]|uniref:glycoside hydrolase family 31 protein n=1 Tax=Litoribacter ruber TaxID=702568 RepID=UPI001BDA5CCE|nr:glycoside hydrolase family 31 protein [Litoribacter ruber]MBT0810585.1 glycoside hydrolase family 31 protein [Litoribacter ruber]